MVDRLLFLGTIWRRRRCYRFFADYIKCVQRISHMATVNQRAAIESEKFLLLAEDVSQRRFLKSSLYRMKQ